MTRRSQHRIPGSGAVSDTASDTDLHAGSEPAGDKADGPDGSLYDLSMDRVPTGWIEAQGASPPGNRETGLASRNTRFSAIPIGHGSPFIANVVALAASFVCGIAWYFAESLNIYRGPWIAVGAAGFIALAVSITGASERSYRAILSVTAYLVTVLAVLIVMTNRDLRSVYGPNYDLGEFEDVLIRTRIVEPTYLLAYALGVLLAGRIGYLPRSRS